MAAYNTSSFSLRANVSLYFRHISSHSSISSGLRPVGSASSISISPATAKSTRLSIAATSTSRCCLSLSETKVLWLRSRSSALSKSIRNPVRARSIKNEARREIISSITSQDSALFSWIERKRRKAARITKNSLRVSSSGASGCISTFSPST